MDGAEQVTVKLTDKREFQAKVLGKDKATDIAVLKIDAHDLPFVKIGDANQERVGEWAVAIGAPFGFEKTATAGIVSAKARSLPDRATFSSSRPSARQSGQLGRTPVQSQRRGRRHQLADLQPAPAAIRVSLLRSRSTSRCRWNSSW